MLFTVLTGLGLGQMAWLGLGLGPDGGLFRWLACALALALAGAGGLASTGHLGRRENAWRAFSQWRSAWLSREACLMLAALAAFGLYAAIWCLGGVRLWGLGLAAAALALATIQATAMIYAQLKAVPRWSVTPTPAINFAARVRFTPDWKPGGFTINGNINSGNTNANITWFRSARTFPDEDDASIVEVTSQDRLSGSARVNLLRSLVTLHGNLTWDVSDRLLQAFMIGGTWNMQCCSIGGQLRRTNFSFRDELQFSVLIELLNVGQLGFGSDGR